MLEKVLVPLDGSQFGEQALPLARSLGALSEEEPELHLVHVHVSVPVFLEGLATLSPELEADREELEREYLQTTARTLEPTWPGEVRTALLRGTAEQAIEEYASAEDIGLIVMSTHGRGGLSRLWLGSVADRVLRESRRPVILHRPRESGGEGDQGEPRLERILVPLDGSPLAEGVLPPALSLGRQLGARLHLLRVRPPFFMVGTPTSGPLFAREETIVAELEDEARSYLEGKVEALAGEGVEVEGRVLSELDPAEAILDEAEAVGADLIAMATHGRGGVSRAVLGSVADKVIRAAHRPVLVVRPGGE